MTTQVLVVVGGALTGLSSAVFLAAHGVPCVVVVVERHPNLLIYILSAARGINLRARSSCFARSDWSPPSAGCELCEQRSVCLRADPRRDSSRRGIYAGIDDEEEGMTHLTQTLLPVPRRSERLTRTSWRAYSGTGRGGTRCC
jgi:hypothetical protein